jgi:hypothetical protein
MSKKIFIQYSYDTPFIGEGGTQVTTISRNGDIISGRTDTTGPDTTVPDTTDTGFIVLSDDDIDEILKPRDLDEAKVQYFKLVDEVGTLKQKVDHLKTGIVHSYLQVLPDATPTDYFGESGIFVSSRLQKQFTEREIILKAVFTEMSKLFDKINLVINQIIELKEKTFEEKKKLPSIINRGFGRGIHKLIRSIFPSDFSKIIIPRECDRTFNVLKEHLELVFQLHMLKMILLGSINLQKYALTDRSELERTLLTNFKNQLGADNLSQEILKSLGLEHSTLLRFSLTASINIISKYILNITQITEQEKEELEKYIREQTEALNEMKNRFETQFNEIEVVAKLEHEKKD